METRCFLNRHSFGLFPIANDGYDHVDNHGVFAATFTALSPGTNTAFLRSRSRRFSGHEPRTRPLSPPPALARKPLIAVHYDKFCPSSDAG
jgi:hypothetical protein